MKIKLISRTSPQTVAVHGSSVFSLSRSTSRCVVGDSLPKKKNEWFDISHGQKIFIMLSSWDSWGYDNSKGGRGGKHGRRYEDSNLDADVVALPITRLQQPLMQVFGILEKRGPRVTMQGFAFPCMSPFWLIEQAKCWQWQAQWSQCENLWMENFRDRFDRDEHGMPRRSRNHAVEFDI